MNKVEFIHFFEANLSINTDDIFEIKKGKYYTVNKMYHLMLNAYDIGTFYNKKILFEYLDIWSYIPDIKNEAVFISQHAFKDEFDKVKNEEWMKRYKVNLTNSI